MTSPAPTPVTDLAQLFALAVASDAPALIQSTHAISLVAAQAAHPELLLPGCISWKQLEGGMAVLFERYWLKFSDDRRQRFAVIADWTLSPALCDAFSAALVEPIATVLRGPDALGWRMLNELQCRRALRMPTRMYPVGEAMRKLAQANPPQRLPRDYKLIVSNANTLCLQNLQLKLVRDGKAPPFLEQSWVLDERMRMVRSLTRQCLLTLLDDELPRLDDPIPA